MAHKAVQEACGEAMLEPEEPEKSPVLSGHEELEIIFDIQRAELA